MIYPIYAKCKLVKDDLSDITLERLSAQFTHENWYMCEHDTSLSHRIDIYVLKRKRFEFFEEHSIIMTTLSDIIITDYILTDTSFHGHNY